MVRRALLAGCAALLAAPQELIDPGWGALALPPGRVARMLERLAPGTAPAALGAPPWPAWSDRSGTGWGGEPLWRRWVELVRAEACAPSTAKAGAPARRAQLAVLAHLQGRDGDAWAHLLACEAEPGLVATLLPFFAPGVPQEWLGRDDPLPDGVLLSPALPPTDDPQAALRWLAGKKLERREFSVGAAQCALSVSVDRDGLEVSLRQLAGGPARVRIVPPLPRGIEPGLLFADWEKLPGHVGPVEFALDTVLDGEGRDEPSEHSLWLTFHPPAQRWPNPELATLESLAPGRRIVVASPRGDEPHLARFTEALGELLGRPAVLCAEGAPLAPGLEPLVLHFDSGPAAERKLVELIGMAEAFALLAANR